MKNFQTYQVHPNIPENLAFLEILSRNVWWCWKKTPLNFFDGLTRRVGWNPGGIRSHFWLKFPRTALNNWHKMTVTWPTWIGLKKRVSKPGS